MAAGKRFRGQAGQPLPARLPGGGKPLLVVLLACQTASAAPSGSWPTLHGDNSRSGCYPEFPDPPLELAWRRELHNELTGPRAEVIVADGVAFMGTYAGNMYALDALTGAERWVIRTGMPIGHSPAVADGVLYFAGMDGVARAVKIATGEVLWESALGSGCWVAPLVHDGAVYLGTRDGVFRALRCRDGSEAWRHRTGDRILTTASLDDSGTRIVTASEDMHVYCFGATDGTLLWKSRKLPGLTLRDYAPLIADGIAMVATNPVRAFHEILDTHERFLLDNAGVPADADADARRYVAGSDADIRREQDAIIAYLAEHPDEQTFHAFRLADGSEPWVAPILYTAGLHNPPSPPCRDPATGEVFVFLRSAYGTWDGGGEVRSLTALGRLDPADGRVELLGHGYPPKEPGRPAGAVDIPWGSFNIIGDETQTLSCSEHRLFSNHQGFLGALDRGTRRTGNLFGKRDTYAGFYGPGNFGWASDGGRDRAAAAGQPFGIVNEWHGPARAIAAVAAGHVYLNVGSQVICLRPRQ